MITADTFEAFCTLWTVLNYCLCQGVWSLGSLVNLVLISRAAMYGHVGLTVCTALGLVLSVFWLTCVPCCRVSHGKEKYTFPHRGSVTNHSYVTTIGFPPSLFRGSGFSNLHPGCASCQCSSFMAEENEAEMKLFTKIAQPARGTARVRTQTHWLFHSSTPGWLVDCVQWFSVGTTLPVIIAEYTRNESAPGTTQCSTSFSPQ